MIFVEVEFVPELVKEFVELLRKSKNMKYFTILKCKCSEDSLIQIINALPNCSLKSFKIQHQKITGKFMEQFSAMLNRYVSLAYQKAEAAINEAKVVIDEENERLAALKKKPKKKKKSKKKGIKNLHLMTPD